MKKKKTILETTLYICTKITKHLESLTPQKRRQLRCSGRVSRSCSIDESCWLAIDDIINKQRKTGLLLLQAKHTPHGHPWVHTYQITVNQIMLVSNLFKLVSSKKTYFFEFQFDYSVGILKFLKPDSNFLYSFLKGYMKIKYFFCSIINEREIVK